MSGDGRRDIGDRQRERVFQVGKYTVTFQSAVIATVEADGEVLGEVAYKGNGIMRDLEEGEIPQLLMLGELLVDEVHTERMSGE